MSTTADFKNGLIIKFNNDFFTIIEFQHVKPGKGGAFVRTKLKSVTTGRTLENTFNAGVSVDIVRIEKQSYKFLYNTNDTYVFMNNATFEQVEINKRLIPNVLLLNDGQDVYMLYYTDEDRILGVEMPLSVEMEIAEVEESCRGNTVTRAMKKAKTVTGLEISVPLFINAGDVIKIDTRTCEYVERVKK